MLILHINKSSLGSYYIRIKGKSEMKVQNVYKWYFPLAAVILYTAFFVIPSIMSFYIGLTDWNAASYSISFIGLDNYKEIFTSSNYIKYLNNTLVFAFVTSVMKIALGLMLALIVNEGLKTKNFLRAVFFAPVAISPLIIGIMFTSVFHPAGLINGFFGLIGLDFLQQNWLADPRFAFPSVMSVEVWRYTGFNMAIFLAGLQMIDKTYYEAAAIDGASPYKMFINITVPYLMPSITINAILNIMQGLRVFDVVYALTHGGPGDITDVLNTVVFREYSFGRYGFSTALGVVLFIITAIISLSMYMFMSKKEVEA